MKISIKHAIESGGGFKCETDTFDGPITFHCRILSFNKIDDSVMKDLQKEIKFDEGILWLLGIEIVNFTKRPISGFHVSNKIVLLDQDEFQFTTISVGELGNTDFGKKEGIYRFSGGSNNPTLKPKIKAVGTLPFLLPYDEKAEYYLSIESGRIQEL